jgi:hypothetical protein
MTFMETNKSNISNAVALTFRGFDDWVELFQAGEQTDSQRNTKVWTHADLDSMVTNHQPSPLVIGHPKTDDPAWGWSSALKRDGDVLLGKFSDVQPEFSKMVENKQFPNRSIKIEPAENGYRLVHTGFLGGIPPAIKGLKQLNFNQNDKAMEFSGDWYVTSRLSRMFRNIKNYLVEDKGQEKADQILPEWELENLSESAVEQRIEESTESDSGSFNKQESQDEPDKGENDVGQFTQADIDAAKEVGNKEGKAAATSEFNTELDALKNKDKLATAQAKVNQLLTDQKLVPAVAGGLAEFMASLDDGDENHFEFSSGEGTSKKTIKQSPAAYFSALLDGLSTHGLLDSQKDDGDLDTQSSQKFNAPDGSLIDEDGLKLDQKARVYMSANQGVSYIDAAAAVQRGE